MVVAIFFIALHWAQSPKLCCYLLELSKLVWAHYGIKSGQHNVYVCANFGIGSAGVYAKSCYLTDSNSNKNAANNQNKKMYHSSSFVFHW